MSLEPGAAGSMVHMPEGDFAFDGEVSSIFDNMAERSIPNYLAVHRLHVAVTRAFRYQLIHQTRFGHAATLTEDTHMEFCVADIGASTARFVEELNRNDGTTTGWDLQGNLHYLAVDVSDAMLARIQDRLTRLRLNNCMTSNHDLSVDVPQTWVGRYHVINCMYVLQFVPPARRLQMLRSLYAMLRPGGYLLLAQKEAVPDHYRELFDREYHRWRIGNGYTVHEIEAKNRALANAMWPDSADVLLEQLSEAGFHFAQETSRWLHFSSVMARKF